MKYSIQMSSGSKWLDGLILNRTKECQEKQQLCHFSGTIILLENFQKLLK